MKLRFVPRRRRRHMARRQFCNLLPRRFSIQKTIWWLPLLLLMLFVMVLAIGSPTPAIAQQPLSTPPSLLPLLPLIPRGVPEFPKGKSKFPTPGDSVSRPYDSELRTPNSELSTPPAIAQQPRQEIRGVWMTSNDTATLRSRAKVRDAVNQLRRLNFNTIYPVIWNAGYVTYPSAVARQMGIQPFVYRGLEGQDILADLITQAHHQGLLVIPWFEFGFMTPPTSELALSHPDWLTQKQDGSQISDGIDGEVVWLNPFRPEVQQFVTALVLEAVTQYDADGIQFDDHTSLPNEFGYDDYTIALYVKETKEKPPINPDDPVWVRWRANKITAFMVQLRQAVKQRKPNAIFSVSPNYYDLAYRFHLQDWLDWVRQNIVDELIVQVYRADLQSFLEQIGRPEIQEAQQKISTGVGILTGLRNNPVPMQQIQSQVQAARSRGLGVSFFYYESLWGCAPESATERQTGFQTLFPLAALRETGSGE